MKSGGAGFYFREEPLFPHAPAATHPKKNGMRSHSPRKRERPRSSCLADVVIVAVFYRPSSAARPPKNHGPASCRPRPSAEPAPLSQPLHSRPTRPTSPPYPAPHPPPSSPPPLPAASRQPHWRRGASNWPPPPGPLRSATQPLPTPAEHNSAHQGGPAFAPATPQPAPSAAACGTPVPRLPPRGFQ
jgi:hypothetical protein